MEQAKQDGKWFKETRGPKMSRQYEPDKRIFIYYSDINMIKENISYICFLSA